MGAPFILPPTPIPTPFSTGVGGTGATSASAARANLGATESGANSTITSLNGLTTALSVAQGGTGNTTGDVSDRTVLATGGTTIRKNSDRAADAINVKNFGAKGDNQTSYLVATIASGSAALAVNTPIFSLADAGKTIVIAGAGAGGSALVTNISTVIDAKNVTLASLASTAVSALAINLTWGTDDTSAINSAISFAKAIKTIASSVALGNVFFPVGEYLSAGSINLTGITQSGIVITGYGARIHSVASGAVAVDALGSRFIRWAGLDIYGDQYATPKIGLQIGRTGGTATNSADNHSVQDANFGGYYTQSCMHNNNSETCQFSKVHFLNNQPNAYSVTLDGLNHWGASSSFVSNTQQVDVQQSFNENLFLNCIFGEYATTGTPLWIAGTGRLRIIGSYAASGGPNAVKFYLITNSTLSQPDFDMHIETGSVTDAFLFTGPATSFSIPGFRFRDNALYASNSVFKIDAGSALTSVTLQNADIDVGFLVTSTANLFDLPSAWTLTGRVYLPSASNFNASSFSGIFCTGSTCTDYLTLPNPLNLPAIAATGSVTAITALSAAQQVAAGTGAYYSQTSGANFDLIVTLSAPSVGGSQATAHVNSMQVFGYPNKVESAGSGYTNGEICIVKTPGGVQVCTVQVAASNGAVSSVTGVSTSPLNGKTIPGGPFLLISSNTGSGATVSGMNWIPSSFVIDNPGSGYPVAPTVTVRPGTGCTVNCPIGTGATAAINGQFSATGGGSALLLDGVGAKIGTSGAAGKPTLSLGAFIRSAGSSSTPSSGATITMAANTDSYGVLGSSTLATLTVLLPPLLGVVGQEAVIDFVPAVTTLTIKNSGGTTLYTTSANALAPRRFRSFDGTSWTQVQ